MTWMTFRQFRMQAIAGLAALVAATVCLTALGLSIRHSFDGMLGGCLPTGCSPDAIEEFTGRYDTVVGIADILLMAVPGLIGVFWGAPLISDEFAAGTQRLAWTQGVTRRRWLTVKLLVVGLVSAALTGSAVLLLTWSVTRYDLVEADRFSPWVFGARGFVPVASALFAFMLGAAAGVLARRPVPAMGLTLAVFALLQFLVPAVVRPYFARPVTDAIALDSVAVRNADSIRTIDDGKTLLITGVSLPDAWVLDATAVVDAQGNPPGEAIMQECIKPDQFRNTLACFAQRNLHVTATYQPAGRFWPFQIAESALYLLLAAVLGRYCFSSVRRRAI